MGFSPPFIGPKLICVAKIVQVIKWLRKSIMKWLNLSRINGKEGNRGRHAAFAAAIEK
jgi:hypothetical protein